MAIENELWLEFVTNVNNDSHNNLPFQPTASAAEITAALKDSNNSRSSFVNGSIDNDDPSDDPDFTVTDNNDLDDPDYMDGWFQVPSKTKTGPLQCIILFYLLDI
jgi:hypothetical protein